ncbi:MAG TPA: HAMP domain-containing sensor histidine kinase [Pyrinomonadaceae bacterium]|jgi:signal transduction histidine kinase|nr:HAMP domain-containing sensor histidine kinase [Pyrinomonadaceae bacterium]
MRIRTRRRSIALIITLGVCMVLLAVALNVTWILLNWQKVALLVLGVIFFAVIITGVVLNTIFLVREIRRNEQHDSFINAVTHELKTPIASMRLYLETLKTREVDEARRREFYDVMLADSDRLLRTVEQVLRAGRTGHRRRRIDTSVIDLGEMVRECVELSRAQHNLDAAAMRFAESFNGDGRALVRGDMDELRAAVANLLDNAVKYSDKEVEVSVEVGTLDAKQAVVRVSDTGVGIPTTQTGRIFKRFYRVPGRVMARVKGTGLGLFIVRAVVRKHGGRVFAESEGLGRGSTFTIQLPRVTEK